jgi:hypothetical protein
MSIEQLSLEQKLLHPMLFNSNAFKAERIVIVKRWLCRWLWPIVIWSDVNGTNVIAIKKYWKQKLIWNTVIRSKSNRKNVFRMKVRLWSIIRTKVKRMNAVTSKVIAALSVEKSYLEQSYLGLNASRENVFWTKVSKYHYQSKGWFRLPISDATFALS